MVSMVKARQKKKREGNEVFCVIEQRQLCFDIKIISKVQQVGGKGE